MGHDSKKNSSNKHDAESEPRQPVGIYLQSERLRKQLSLEKIAEETCIHITTLRAIEENDRSKMPAEVFTRGFIKLYAELLGLDKQHIIERYDREKLQAHEDHDPNHDLFSTDKSEYTHSIFSLRNFIILVALAALAVILFLVFTPSRNQTASSTPTLFQSSENESIPSSNNTDNAFAVHSEGLIPAPPSSTEQDQASTNEQILSRE